MAASTANDFSLLFALLIAATGIIFVAVVLIIYAVKRHKDAQLQSVSARVVSRRAFTINPPPGDASGPRYTTPCYLTFSLENGGRVELSVPLDVFNYFADGTVGTLSYRGNEFLSFTI